MVDGRKCQYQKGNKNRCVEIAACSPAVQSGLGNLQGCEPKGKSRKTSIQKAEVSVQTDMIEAGGKRVTLGERRTPQCTLKERRLPTRRFTCALEGPW